MMIAESSLNTGSRSDPVPLEMERGEGYSVARIKGVLDESLRAAFREDLHPLVSRRGAALILDLSGSVRVNSQGLSQLVALTADAHTNGSRVILCNLQSHVAVVVAATRLDRYFTIAEDLPEAIVSAHSRPDLAGPPVRC